MYAQTLNQTIRLSKVEISEKKNRFRNFLFKLVNKKFLVFLFFFAVSGVFWLAISLREPMEREILIPVEFTNVPPNEIGRASCRERVLW